MNNFLDSFSTAQRQIIRTALVLAAALAIAWLLFQVFQVLALFVTTFSGVIWPVAVATILALLLRPVVTFMVERLKVRKLFAIITLFALVGVGLTFIGMQLPKVVDSAIDFVRGLPTLISNIGANLQERFPRAIAFLENNVGAETLASFQQQAQQIAQNLAGASVPFIQSIGSNLMSTLGIIAGLAVIPVLLFYFLETEHDVLNDLDRQLSWMKPQHREDLIFLIREFLTIIVSFFRGQLLIALMIAVILTVSFSLVGLRGALVLGPVLGLLNVVPLLGHIIGLLVTLPIAYFQDDGGLLLMGLVFLIFTAAQSIDSYLLQPWIMGERTGLHPVVVILSVFFWGTAIGGILGLILAVPLTAFFVVFWRLLRHKYLESKEEEAPQPAKAEEAS